MLQEIDGLKTHVAQFTGHTSSNERVYEGLKRFIRRQIPWLILFWNKNKRKGEQWVARGHETSIGTMENQNRPNPTLDSIRIQNSAICWLRLHSQAYYLLTWFDQTQSCLSWVCSLVTHLQRYLELIRIWSIMDRVTCFLFSSCSAQKHEISHSVRRSFWTNFLAYIAVHLQL